MELTAIIGVVVSVLGGWSYAGSLIFTHLGEREILKYLSYVCYQKILQGEDIFWEDLELLYETETKKIVGYSGVLTPPEGHELVMLINQLCKKRTPEGTRWNLIIRNLTRSLPQGWVVAVGQNYIQNFGGLMMLMGMLGIFMILRGHAVQFGLVTATVIAGIPALIFLVATIIQFNMFFPFWRATRKIKELVFKL